MLRNGNIYDIIFAQEYSKHWKVFNIIEQSTEKFLQICRLDKFQTHCICRGCFSFPTPASVLFNVVHCGTATGSVQVWQCVYFPRVQGDFGTVPLTSDSIVTFTPCSICIQASHWRRMFRRFTLRAFPVLGHLRPDIQKRSVRRGRRKNWPNDDNRNLLIRSHCWEREFNTPPPPWSLRACPGCEPNLR